MLRTIGKALLLKLLRLGLLVGILFYFGFRISFQEAPDGPSAQALPQIGEGAAGDPSVEDIMRNAEADILRNLEALGAGLAAAGSPRPRPVQGPQPAAPVPAAPLPAAAPQSLPERRLPQITGRPPSRPPVAERKVIRVGE